MQPRNEPFVKMTSGEIDTVGKNSRRSASAIPTTSLAVKMRSGVFLAWC
jgi:hypothetical protein